MIFSVASRPFQSWWTQIWQKPYNNRFSEDEVTKALFHMSLLKSPGPDGVPPIFFHKFWHVVKSDVVACVLKFLNHCILPPSFNDTNIVLIPKYKNPETLAQFLPISLCNVVYKIASKTIANRLKPWLDSIISPSQSAFVPGCLITNNVLLAFEINHYLNTRTKGRKHFMNLKLDISKAYDRVEWSFLRRVLGKLDFPCSFIELIMLCITSVKYLFVLSSTQFGSISPHRGLRQGDPLLPYLFLLCTESLSSLFRAADERGTISGVAVCWGAPKISHLLFADDTMIFCLANPTTVKHVRRTLETYKKVPDQEINLSKSSAAFSRNTLADTRALLAAELCIRLENKHEVYLGLPAIAFRSKRALFAHLKDKIWKRIHGWHERTLSQAGKACLIQAVVQTIPSYAMFCFRLPKTLVKEFQSLTTDFFWHDGERKHIHWLAWDKLCSSKLEGGLGFRNLEAFNLALLAKQLWRLLTRQECLVSKVLKAKYFPRHHLFEAQAGVRPSFTWRSIIAARNLLWSGCRGRIGSGHLCSFARQVWACSNFRWFNIGAPASSVEDWFRSILLKLQPTEFDLVLMVCWAVWWSKNLKTLNKAFLFPQQTVDFARSYLLAFESTCSSQVPRRLGQSPSWSPPHSDAIKINFDGLILDGGTTLGIGVVTRDSSGMILFWQSFRLPRRGTTIVAEALAAREAIKLAVRQSWQQVRLEGDCVTLMNKLSASAMDQSFIRPLIFDIKTLALTLNSVSFLFVPHSGNRQLTAWLI
ncbi:UNVERIFIED_CONTAM: putative mitochondrial protein [Sesamum latifolium]|uniref:Mitochondrial protein n=1 Tax=Sesamum latifolium TaxID=2727402 RepID=A0AAW2X6Y8_9LAMI